MNIQHLSITPLSTDRSSHYDQLLPRDKVPYAALMFCGFGAWMRLDVEFEPKGGWDER